MTTTLRIAIAQAVGILVVTVLLGLADLAGFATLNLTKVALAAAVPLAGVVIAYLLTIADQRKSV